LLALGQLATLDLLAADAPPVRRPLPKSIARMTRTRAAVVIVIVGLLGGAAWLRASIRGYEQQINNLETFKGYRECLDRFREKAGRFPARFEEIRDCDIRYSSVPFGMDWWRNPVTYQSDGVRFVLVSLGRDGKADGLDPWKLRENNNHDSAVRRTCGHPDADQVMSDLGFHRACFK
jgi:hypothetical protein